MRYTLTVLFIIVIFTLRAQTVKEKFSLDLYKDISPYYTFSYWGEFIFHPGIKIGYDIPFYNRGKIKMNPKWKKFSFRLHQFFLNPNMGYFIHPGNHQGLSFGYDIGYRFTFKCNKDEFWRRNGFFIEVFSNIDYFIQINNGTTYRQNKKGQIVKSVPLKHYFMPGVAFGLGYSFNESFMMALRPDISFQMPYSAFVLPRAFMEICVFHTLK